MGTVSELFAAPVTELRRRGDGTVLLSSGLPLGEPAATVTDLYRTAAGGAVLAGQRSGSGWRTVTYGMARDLVAALAQSLLDRELADRPIMVLSGNSIEHLLLTLAGHRVGAPVVPVSTAYSLLSADHATLRSMVALTDPGLVYADDEGAYGPALAAVNSVRSPRGRRLLVTPQGDPPLEELLHVAVGADVEKRAAEVGPDTVAKILFTSGSTGRPKGVITTHGMLTANQQMLRTVWPFLAREPPVLVDWLPWSHSFGGNHNLNLVLASGGTLWIDDGRPTPELFGRTLRALGEISPTIHFNVPSGYALLVPALEADPALARRFFARLQVMFCAGAAVPQQVWDRIGALADRAGAATVLTTAWGTTETGPGATLAHFATDRAGCIGVPLPGVEVKLAPVGGKTEIRVRGPNITPGYLGRPDLTAQAFDEDGFYRTGDAVTLVDDDDPDRGLRFDGRIAEDFKLLSGTWVSVGTLRPALLDAGRGLLRDVVLTGHDRGYVAALVWLHADRERELGPAGVRAELAAALDRHNFGSAGSARRVRRLLVAAEPPSLAHGEITDKGYVNQRAVLDRRADLVDRLYAEPCPPGVVG